MLLLILLVGFVHGCKKYSVDEDTAIKIYVENIVAEEKYFSNPDSLILHRQKIYEKYKTSKTDYDNYLKSFEGNQEKWDLFFKEAESYLNELKKKGIIK